MFPRRIVSRCALWDISSRHHDPLPIAGSLGGGPGGRIARSSCGSHGSCGPRGCYDYDSDRDCNYEYDYDYGSCDPDFSPARAAS